MQEKNTENEEVMELTAADWEDQRLIGAELRRHRETLGWSEEEMSVKMGPGYSAELVSQYEAGSVPMQIGPFLAMLTALNLTVDDVAPGHLRIGRLIHSGYLKLNERSRNAVDQIIDVILMEQQAGA